MSTNEWAAGGGDAPECIPLIDDEEHRRLYADAIAALDFATHFIEHHKTCFAPYMSSHDQMRDNCTCGALAPITQALTYFGYVSPPAAVIPPAALSTETQRDMMRQLYTADALPQQVKPYIALMINNPTLTWEDAVRLIAELPRPDTKEYADLAAYWLKSKMPASPVAPSTEVSE